MDLERILRAIESDPHYAGQIYAQWRTPAVPGRYVPADPPLPPALAASLGRLGIGALYEHQAAALAAARAGRNVVVDTPTASGKSLCFHLPVLEVLAREPGARALYLFPTKALARDQMSGIAALAPEVFAGAYDADTPGSERGRIRSEAGIVLTNPDLLHLGILPHHLGWDGFFSGLRYVAVDEIHTYRGVFGTHVGHVLRRLRRVALAHGANPQFLMASATIANPAEHAEALIGGPVSLIRGNAAPRGERLVVLWDAYRPRRALASLAQAAYLEDATWLLGRLIAEGVRTIVFTRSRQVTERLLINLARHLEAAGRPSLLAKVRPYRGGYLPAERRAIERQLFAGELLGVISTSALELGVDIGGLEAALIVGFPGTMASFWQQAGRAGRGAEPALAVYIPGPNLLERYLLRHPDYLFGRPCEHAVTDPGNPYILADHLAAAAFEWPLSREDTALWGQSCPALADLLASEGRLAENPVERRWYFAGGDYPAARVGLRGSTGQYDLIVDGSTIGTIDAASALAQVHPGAVYLHAGESYLVQALDPDRRLVSLVPAVVDYYTEATVTTEVEVVEEYRAQARGGWRAFLGEVIVTTRTIGYQRRQAATGAVLARLPLALPAQELRTTALGIALAAGQMAVLSRRGLDAAGGLHGLEHLLIGLLPLTALCDRWDVGGSSLPAHPATGGAPTVFIYDAAAGGLGFAERAFDGLTGLLARAEQAITACPCRRGCPSCIQSPKCGNHNQPLDKEAVKEILRLMQNETA